MSRIAPYVPEHILLRLRAVVVDNVTGSRDSLSWGGSPDGQFSVKSAYWLITQEAQPRQTMDKFWRQIWRSMVPERVRSFMWLVGHRAIMSNSERFRRHLCDSPICQVCKSGEETILHILRDCPAMAGIWHRIVLARKLQSFFAAPLLEWLYENLNGERNDSNSSWPTLFGMALWWSWKWRCGNIFGYVGRCRDIVKFIKDIAKEVVKANALVNTTQPTPVRTERMIAWVPPCHGWLKVNTDGASRDNPGLALAGGVLRDTQGNWLGGFSLNIGICSARLAELWGAYYGLFLAWERRPSSVVLEVDSAIVAGFLNKGVPDAHPLSFLVRLCHGFILKDRNVRIVHVYREANRLADGLANRAFNFPLGFHSFDVVPDSLSLILLEDMRGSALPRQVCI